MFSGYSFNNKLKQFKLSVCLLHNTPKNLKKKRKIEIHMYNIIVTGM